MASHQSAIRLVGATETRRSRKKKEKKNLSAGLTRVWLYSFPPPGP